MIGAKMDLESARDEHLHLPVAGSRNLLTGPSCSDRTGHSDFEVLEGRSTGFFVLVSVTEPISLLLFPASHTYMHYAMAHKKKLVELLHVEDVRISAFLYFSCTGPCSMNMWMAWLIRSIIPRIPDLCELRTE